VKAIGEEYYFNSITVNLEAIIGIIFSITETYPKETARVVFSYLDELNEEYVCIGAARFQTVKRRGREVEWDNPKENRINHVGRLLRRWETIGNFHSHSYPNNQIMEADPWPGPDDLKS